MLTLHTRSNESGNIKKNAGLRHLSRLRKTEHSVSTAAIYKTIEMAKLHEQQTGCLANSFEKQIQNNLHVAIQLPTEGAGQGLVDFIIAYVEHVPHLLDAVRDITKEANIEEYTEPFLKLAEDFFLKPPEIISGHIGLEELMDEAYLAHRLLEEVNDRFMLKASIPLVPVDMTTSNLIVHSLIGEPFANELDEAVSYTVERAMMKEHVYDSEAFKAYVDKHKNHQWEQEQARWPCLTDDLSIRLQFIS